MPGKRTMGGKARKSDERVRQTPSKEKFLDQFYWRKDCLKARAKAGKLTEKNKVEVKNLGINL
jgi:hypothetical protein